MKKTIYFLTMILAVALMSTSCCKDDPDVPEPQTLEEQYPEWSDLSWVSTDGNDVNHIPIEETYPRLEITIVGDVASIFQATDGVGGGYAGNFPEVTISGNVITFSGDGFKVITGTFEWDSNSVTFITKGLTPTTHTYVLD
jgi:hypothetical protein